METARDTSRDFLCFFFVCTASNWPPSRICIRDAREGVQMSRPDSQNKLRALKQPCPTRNGGAGL